jgi:hypothetical protein
LKAGVESVLIFVMVEDLVNPLTAPCNSRPSRLAPPAIRGVLDAKDVPETQRPDLRLGFGRIVVLEKKRGTEYVSESGIKWMSRWHKVTMRNTIFA